MFRYLSMNNTCISTEKRLVYRERSSRNTVSFDEQIMSNDKYPSKFSSRIEATCICLCLLSFKYFSQHMWFCKLGNTPVSLRYSPVWAVMSLDQLRSSYQCTCRYMYIVLIVLYKIVSVNTRSSLHIIIVELTCFYNYN